MITIVKIILGIVLVTLLNSCKTDFNFNSGIEGNGIVVSTERKIDKEFSSIKASEGLEVFLTQDTKNTLKIQADENIQKYIITEVKDGTLTLHTSEQLGKVNSKKVFINFKSINNIKSTSGVLIKTTKPINSDLLNIQASSGSTQRLIVKTENINCSSSSGASILLEGKSLLINASASSGSSINALKLISENCETRTSSGANINVFCSSEINSTASSGSRTIYGGNPKLISKIKSSGAQIFSF